jgi:hypothetical protein
MNIVKDVAWAIAGLFVDDGHLALWIALVLAFTGFLASTPWFDGRALGAGFVLAVVIVLLMNVRRG